MWIFKVPSNENGINIGCSKTTMPYFIYWNCFAPFFGLDNNGVSSCPFLKFPYDEKESSIEKNAALLYLLELFCTLWGGWGRHYHAQPFIKPQKSTPSNARRYKTAAPLRAAFWFAASVAAPFSFRRDDNLLLLRFISVLLGLQTKCRCVN